MASRHDLYWMLHLPPETAQKVVPLQHLINHSYSGPSRPMAWERLHATLLPLGSYRHAVPGDVLRMALSAGELLDEAPFRVSFDTLQSRGPKRELGSVELAGRGAGVLPLHRLRRHLVAAQLKAGWPAECIRPAFYPHITLDYQHRPVAPRRVPALEWDVTEVHLVDSHFGEGHHEVLACHVLKNRQPSLFE